MGKIETDIFSKMQKKQPVLAVLIDPDKPNAHLKTVCEQLQDSAVDYVFVGGSTGEKIEQTVSFLKKNILQPIVLFPGNVQQLSCSADALLFLNLIQSTDYQLLTGNHILVARRVKSMGIETIPMGYILVDGGTHSSVSQMTRCKPFLQNDIDAIVDTAIAAELLGKHLIYLEAGSGAKIPVNTDIIDVVKKNIGVPLIVGGGITTITQMNAAFCAGADIVVIGNYFEQNPQQIRVFAKNKAK